MAQLFEDVVYEMLPVVGMVSLISAIFVLVILRNTSGILLIFRFFAIIDLLNGISVISAGIFGVLITFNGHGNDEVQPVWCLSHAPQIHLWAFTDSSELLLLLTFVLDRLLQIILPQRYGSISKYYLRKSFGIVVFLLACGAYVPAFTNAWYANETVSTSIMCRYEEVVGEAYFSIRMFLLEWMPLWGMTVIGLIVLTFYIRQCNQRWSYNWTEDNNDTKQLLALAFLRCLLHETAVRMVVLNLALTERNSEMKRIRDYLFRMASCLLISVLQPVIYMMILRPFGQSVSNTFNAYSQNTERKWQSANDPPADLPKIQMESNEFGSWYSMSGNIVGEAGIPMEMRAEKEKSASFYMDAPAPSESNRPFPPAEEHKSNHRANSKNVLTLPDILPL